MNALQRAVLLGQFRDTGTLADTGKSIARWFLPTMVLAGELPIVPDGAVKGQHYIPPNTTVDVVGSIDSIQKSATRIVGATAAVGLVIGAIGGYIAGKNKRRS